MESVTVTFGMRTTKCLFIARVSGLRPLVPRVVLHSRDRDVGMSMGPRPRPMCNVERSRDFTGVLLRLSFVG